MRYFIAVCIVSALAMGVFAVKKDYPVRLPSTAGQNKELVEIGGVEYFFAGAVAVFFEDARVECSNMNMSLLSLQSLEKNELFVDFLQENPIYDRWLWTSGHRDINSTQWLWTSTNEDFTYIGWANGQPDTSDDVEDCADFSGTSNGWEDDQCDHWEMSYVCEPLLTSN